MHTHKHIGLVKLPVPTLLTPGERKNVGEDKKYIKFKFLLFVKWIFDQRSKIKQRGY